MRSHYCGQLDTTHLDQEVELYGWVRRRRDHGGVIFIDLRDREGIAQIVFDPDREEAFASADMVRNEYVLRISGRVRKRPEGTINPDMPTHSGTGLYAISKSAGQEICRIFAENHNIYVINLLFNHLRAPFEPRMAVRVDHFWPFSVAKKDAGLSFLSAIEVDTKKLSSFCENFFISASVPHNQYSNTKAREILGWQPTNNFEKHWKQSAKN